MAKRSLNPNAAKALEEMKMEIANEIANEIGLSNSQTNYNQFNNIFTAGPVGGLMTRNLVKMGEEELSNKKPV